MFRRSTAPPCTSTTRTPGEVRTVTDATFLDDTAGDVAIVDFWAPWCGPCRSFAPIFHDVAAERGVDGFRFGTCDVDQNPATAAMLGIQSIPTIVAFDPAGNEVGRITGVPSRRQLEQLVLEAEEQR